jgi:hypothetical protein
MKGNNTIPTNKEMGMSNCACEEEEHLLYLCFPFPFILEEMWQNIWT